MNTQSTPGANISCDLHIEHLNRRLKGMIKNIHASNPDVAIDHAAKSVGIINQLCEIFKHQNKALVLSGKHSRPAFLRKCS